METPNSTGLVEKPILGESYVKWTNNHFLSLYFCYPGGPVPQKLQKKD